MADITFIPVSCHNTGGETPSNTVEDCENKYLNSALAAYDASEGRSDNYRVLSEGDNNNTSAERELIDEINDNLSGMVPSELDDVSNPLTGSAFIIREDVLLLDPATDLVMAREEEACVAMYSDCPIRLDDASDGEDELVEECERVLHICENADKVKNVQDLMKMNSLLTDVITKIETNGPVLDYLSPSSENEDVNSDGETDTQSTNEAISFTQCKESCVETEANCTVDRNSDRSHICLLPVEILHKVFSYLTTKELCTTVAPVCKLWSDLAYDPIHWQKLDLNSFGSPPEEVFCKLIDRCHLLRDFSISSHHDLTHSGILYLVEHSPMLKSLNLGFSRNVDVCLLEKIVDNCTELENLNIEGVAFSDAEAVASLLCKLTKLNSLNLSHCNVFDDNYVILLSQNLAHLTEINIADLPWITDVAVKELARVYQEQLKSVILDGEELTDASAEALSKCRRLQRLHIPFCEELTDRTLMFVKTMSSLVDLKLRKGYQFSGVMLEKMFEGSNLSQVQHLNLSECTMLQDDGVMTLAKCCGGSLKELELCWCWNITDVGIKAIIEYCRKLVKLNLTGLQKITGHDLPDVPLSMPNLLVLDLTECDIIDDDLAIQVALIMPQLTVFNYHANNILMDSDFI